LGFIFVAGDTISRVGLGLMAKATGT